MSQGVMPSKGHMCPLSSLFTEVINGGNFQCYQSQHLVSIGAGLRVSSYQEDTPHGSWFQTHVWFHAIGQHVSFLASHFLFQRIHLLPCQAWRHPHLSRNAERTPCAVREKRCRHQHRVWSVWGASGVCKQPDKGHIIIWWCCDSTALTI